MIIGPEIASRVAVDKGGETTAVPDSSVKLKKAAQEFESILLATWLEKMNQSFVGCSDSQDPARDTIGSLGTQAIASALAARGGIGIADMLTRQLQKGSTEPANSIAGTLGLQPPAMPAVAGNGSGIGSTLKLSHQLPIIQLQGNK